MAEEVSTKNSQTKSDVANNTTKNEEISFISHYDEVLPYLGDIGVWQAVLTILLAVMAMDGGILVLLQNFTALEPKVFRCAISICDGPNAAYTDLPLFPIRDCISSRYPYINDTNNMCWISSDKEGKDFSQLSKMTKINDKTLMCYKPIVPSSNQPQMIPPMAANCSFLSLDVITDTEHCDVTDPDQKILYEPYEFLTTIVTEFNLVCDQQYKIALSGTFYMIGGLIGSFIGGPPADMFGRKPVLFFFLISAGTFTLQYSLLKYKNSVRFCLVNL